MILISKLVCKSCGYTYSKLSKNGECKYCTSILPKFFRKYNSYEEAIGEYYTWLWKKRNPNYKPPKKDRRIQMRVYCKLKNKILDTYKECRTCPLAHTGGFMIRVEDPSKEGFISTGSEMCYKMVLIDTRN